MNVVSINWPPTSGGLYGILLQETHTHTAGPWLTGWLLVDWLTFGPKQTGYKGRRTCRNRRRGTQRQLWLTGWLLTDWFTFWTKQIGYEGRRTSQNRHRGTQRPFLVDWLIFGWLVDFWLSGWLLVDFWLTDCLINWPPTSGGLYGNLLSTPPQEVIGWLVDFLHGCYVNTKNICLIFFWLTGWLLVDWLAFGWFLVDWLPD